MCEQFFTCFVNDCKQLLLDKNVLHKEKLYRRANKKKMRLLTRHPAEVNSKKSNKFY